MLSFLKKNIGYSYIVAGTIISGFIALYISRAWLLPLLLFVLFYPFFLSQWVRQRRRKLLIATLIFLCVLFIFVNVVTPFYPSRADNAFFHNEFLRADGDYRNLLGKPGIDNIFREGVTLLVIAGGVSFLSLVTMGILYVPAITLVTCSYSVYMLKYYGSQPDGGFTAVLPVLALALLKILITALWGLICSEILISKVFSYNLTFKTFIPVVIPATVLTVLDLALAASL